MRVNGGFFGLRGLAAVLPLSAALLAPAPAPAASSGLFADFSGQWTGTGSIGMADGSHERIKCRANYTTGPSGQTLNINVDCASDSYRVNIISNVVAQGSQFSGTWRETTRQVSGDVSGRVPGPGEFQASLSGVGFGLELAASSNGKAQKITINAQGTDVQHVDISLRRA